MPLGSPRNFVSRPHRISRPGYTAGTCLMLVAGVSIATSSLTAAQEVPAKKDAVKKTVAAEAKAPAAKAGSGTTPVAKSPPKANPTSQVPATVQPGKLDPAKKEPTKKDQPKDLSADAKKLDPLAGHSAHGEAFNEGPRQKAFLMGGTGNVNLTITTKSPEAQKFFNQGIGQLHGFWTYEAERSFRQVAAIDSECAMAYWGLAMANFANANRSKGFLKEAMKHRGKASRREQMWIDGLNNYFNAAGDDKTKRKAYISSLDNLAIEFPDELEAKAFLAWAIWDSDRHGKNFDSHTSVDALIGAVLEKNPLHPVHHYRIHLWDFKKPELAVKSSALSGPSAPTVAHMWHMAGHIYWRLNRYHDSAYMQEASARADHLRMMRDHVLPYQIHNYAHNNEWCCRSLLNIGRVHDAVDLAKNMIEQPRHPSLNHLGNAGSSSHYGRSRLLEALQRYELWDDAIALCNGMHLEPTDQLEEQVKRFRMLGRSYIGKGDVVAAQKIIDDVQKQLTEIKQQQDKAGQDAEAKIRAANPQPAKQQKPADVKAADVNATNAKSSANPKDSKQAKAVDPMKIDRDAAKARDDARKPFDGKVTQLQQALDELNGRLSFHQGKHDDGLKLLQKTNGVLKEHLAMFHSLAGKHDEAIKLAKQVRDANKNEVHPLAVSIDVLFRAGKKEEAKKLFDELRAISEAIDLDTPPMQRLAPIAKEFNLPADWRQKRETPTDIGQRPPLPTLGPFRWEPTQAEPWTLPTGVADKKLSHQDFHGKPVIVIFYLGYGCLHCAQQVEKFALKTEDFRKAGIELVAISTDTADKLHKSVEKYEGETATRRSFPIPLAADPEHNVFKRYRAYDDFERVPLHGTFLIDPAGLVRWQDIGYQPFMDADFLLKEAQRLLKK